MCSATSVERELHPLTDAQFGIWMAQGSDPTSTVFSLNEYLEIDGPIDAELFESSLRSVVAQVDTLHLRFVDTEAGPRQFFAPNSDWPLPVVDVCDAADPLEAAERHMHEDAAHVFDLANGPLFRHILFRLGPHRHVWYACYHHLCNDGFGMGLLARKVAEAYTALVDGKAVAPAGFRSWLDLRADEEAYGRSEQAGRDRDHFAEVLRGRPDPVTLSGKPAAPARTCLRSKGSTAHVAEGLRDLRKRCKASLPQLLIASLALYLHRMTGHDDLVLGIVLSGRTELPMLDVVGLVARILPLRLSIDPHEGVGRLIEQTIAAMRALGEHQRFPQERIRSEAGLRPDEPDVFGTIVNVMLFNGDVRFAGHATRLQNLSHAIWSNDLSVNIIDRRDGQGLQIELIANPDHYAQQEVDAHLACFLRLLEGMVRDPDLPLYRLDLLDPAERVKVLETFQPTARLGPRGLIAELFEEQVARAPEAIALELGDESLTYAELDRRANRLAHHLIGLGVGPETNVGLCLDRSVEMIVGTLAIVKAGGSYLPLDPEYPGARHEQMLGDAAAPLVVTTSAHSVNLPDRFRRLLLDAPETVSALAQSSERSPTSADRTAPLLPSSPAYVMYTSGSTGKAKGIIIPQAAVVRLVQNPNFARLDSETRFLQFAPCTFDAATIEIWGPLLNGGTLAIMPPGLATPQELGEALERHRVNSLWLTSGLFNQMVDDALPALAGVRQLLAGGDVLSVDHVRKVLEAHPQCQVINGYGPTENTTFTACYHIPPDEDFRNGIPIGPPISKTGVYVLDRFLELVPIGATGELYITGAGLARCYLNRPGLTAERFVPDPYAAEPGARMYRTGDLVRWREDGVLEFFGRGDHQLKIRGFRIEPGEVEAALLAEPGTAQAAVIAREDGPGGKQLVAYVVPQPGAQLDPALMRRHLQSRMPNFMVPAAIMLLESLPLTQNGKLDRRALPRPTGLLSNRQQLTLPVSPTEKLVAGMWQDVLAMEQVGVDENFFDLGGHSLLMTRLLTRLRKEVTPQVKIVDLFRFTTVRALAAHIDGLLGPETKAAGDDKQGELRKRIERQKRAESTGAIAIVGMNCRFPDAPDPDQFWRNLCAGHESVRPLSDDDLRRAGVDPAIRARPNFVDHGVMLDGYDLFAADFFGFSPRDAQMLDPQQRLFLECAWHALEDAGYDPARYDKLAGVFAGADLPVYLMHLHSHPELLASVGDFAMKLANDKDYLATRVAYKFNLKGPAFTIQTACSTSLVAICQACQNLLTYQCDLALAGGSCVSMPHGGGYLWQEGSIQSPDGRCRAFDAAGKGMMPGSGCGIVVLKRLDDALADGDDIRAVIRGFAVNNDGSDKIGFTAPSVDGQAQAIATAIAMAGVDCDSISYIEAHGTGTPLGDPIEIAALTQVFRTQTERKGFCGIGSVKTNVGHLSAAAGVAGLIKATLALEHKVIPPSLHFERPNPNIDFENSPLFVVDRLRPWEDVPTPRRAGVSSFGVGGTNAHVVLEEAPPATMGDPGREWQVLPLSASSPAALDQATTNLAAWLKEHPEADLANVAWTLQVGRQQFLHRRALVVGPGGAANAAEVLERRDRAQLVSGDGTAQRLPIVFMFPGQGEQHVGMGRALYESEPFFRDRVDECCDLLREHLGTDLREILFPDPSQPAAVEAAAAALTRTEIVQPALFVIEYSLARLWMEWGVVPDALVGHSIGEYVAACLAGVFSLRDGLDLIAARGRLMQSMPAGLMLAVFRPESEMKPLLEMGLSLAAVNGPALCVLSGTPEAIERAEAELTGRSVQHKRLRTSHAFHSAMMDPIVGSFVEQVRKVDLKPPTLRYVSNLTGTWITPEQAIDPAYWGQHLRQAVRFADDIVALLEGSAKAFVEVGPGSTLSSLVRMSLKGPGSAVLSSLSHAKDETPATRSVMTALATLWVSGGAIDWPLLHAGCQRRRVRLPVYPFERQRYWVDFLSSSAPPAESTLLADAASNGAAPHHASNGSAQSAQATPAPPARGTGAPRPGLATPYVAPRNAVEQKLAKIWSVFLGWDTVGIDDNFFDLGGHSLLAIRMFAEIEAEFGHQFPLDTIFQAGTIAKLAELLKSPGPVGEVSKFVDIRPEGTKPPLFVLHSLRGKLLFWQHFLPYLDPQQPIIGIPFPYEGNDVPSHVDFEALASDYVDNLIAARPTGSFRLAGFSFGGHLAYEMARQLHERGRRVAFLGILDTPAKIGQRSLARTLASAPYFVRNLPLWFLDDALQSSPGSLVRRFRTSAREALQNLRGERVRRYDDMDFNPDLPESLRAIGITMGQALEDYAPRPFPGELTLLRCRSQAVLAARQADYGWSEFVDRVTVRVVARCRHFPMVKDPHVEGVARALQEGLDAVADQ